MQEAAQDLLNRAAELTESDVRSADAGVFEERVLLPNQEGGFNVCWLLHALCGACSSMSALRAAYERTPAELQAVGDPQVDAMPLAWAATNDHIDSETLLWLHEQNGDAASRPDAMGRYPFHQLCRSNHALSGQGLLETMEGLQPLAATTTDAAGKTPLHHACSNQGASMQALMFVVFKWPESPRMRDSGGALPLHYAAFANHTIDVNTLSYLAGLCAEALSACDFAGHSVLHLACANSGASVDVIKWVSAQIPTAATVLDEDGNTPFHAHVKDNRAISLESMSFVASLCPEAMRSPNRSGALPLHLAAANPACREAEVSWLASQVPAALTAADSEKRLPFHVFCRYNPLVTPSLLAQWAELCPQAIAVFDEAGLLPLHYLATNPSASRDAIAWLVEQCREAVVTPDRVQGRLPFHLLCMANVGVTTELLDLLHDIHPDAVRAVDTEGLLPLHYLMENEGTTETELMWLYDKYPEAIHTASSDGSLPIHRLCRYNTRIPLSLLEKVVELYSDGFTALKHSGGNVLHMLCANGGVYPALLQYAVNRDSDMARVAGLDQYPLRTLLMSGGAASVQNVQIVHEAYPDAISATMDLNNTLPLHTAAANSSAGLGTLAYLVSQSSGALDQPCLGGYLPLQVAVGMREGIFPQLLELLCPGEQISHRADNGSTALHMAAANRKISNSALVWLAQRYPQALTMANSEGMLPVQLASAAGNEDGERVLTALLASAQNA